MIFNRGGETRCKKRRGCWWIDIKSSHYAEPKGEEQRARAKLWSYLGKSSQSVIAGGPMSTNEAKAMVTPFDNLDIMTLKEVVFSPYIIVPSESPMLYKIPYPVEEKSQKETTDTTPDAVSDTCFDNDTVAIASSSPILSESDISNIDCWTRFESLGRESSVGELVEEEPSEDHQGAQSNRKGQACISTRI